MPKEDHVMIWTRLIELTNSLNRLASAVESLASTQEAYRYVIDIPTPEDEYESGFSR
jgi:hypothetical protein